MYRFEAGGQRKVLDFLTGALPNLFSEADAIALTNKLDPQKIREYLIDMRRRMAGFESMVLKDMVAADPIWMTELVGKKVLPLQTGFGDAKIDEGGRITSGDGKHILLLAWSTKLRNSSHKEYLRNQTLSALTGTAGLLNTCSESTTSQPLLNRPSLTFGTTQSAN